MLIIPKGNPLRTEIGCVNWPSEYPDKPEVSLLASHSGRSLRLRYEVTEDAVRAVCASDREHCWEDSCVEFFFAPREDGLYYNVECTCAGKLYMGVGTGRAGREFLPVSAYGGIGRLCSLGTDAFGLREERTFWSVELEIPASTFGLSSFDGLKARGNFYKCGNMLPRRHFITMFPVGTPSPDFHRPEFFDKIEFE